MFRQAIRCAILPVILACVCGTGCGGEPGSDTPLQLAGHVNYCVAADQYDFSQAYFLPVKFRPIAAAVPGLEKCEMSLDGKWRINPAPPEGFEEQTEEGEGWHDFNVPGQWVQQGFDIPQEKTAGMSKTFDIPESWAGKRIILRFDAIHAGTTYWLNGKKLGYSENLFTPVEFDITDAALPGKTNRIVMSMKVMTISEIASFSCRYAFHSLGGIDRSVHLFALPAAYISRLHYTTPLDSEYRNATLSLDVSIDNPTDKPMAGLSLVMTLVDPDGKGVKLEQSKFNLPAVEPGESRFSPALPAANPTKWNSEKPVLYKLTVELQQDGKVTERIEQPVGFRHLEIKEKQLYLNGRWIKLTGAIHHEVNPLAARAATGQYGEADAKLFKGANLNYLRTTHYPGTAELFDACDRVGVYVECEAPFCWSPNRDDPNSTKQFLAGQAATIEFNRNHPSILIWSLENETPWGLNFAETLKLVKREDQSRFAVCNFGLGPGCDITVWHYPLFPFESQQHDPQHPTLFDEYIPSVVHLFPEEYELNPGQDVTWSEGQNSPDSYICQMYASRQVVGGAVTAGGDEQFYFQDRSVRGYGQWGFIDVWRRKKSIWWDAKLMHSPIWIPVRKMAWVPGEKVVTIPIENRYSFTDLSEVKCTWELGGKGGTIDLSLPPQAKGEIKAPVGESTQPGDMIVLRFTDARGELITAHGVKLAAADDVPPDPSKEYIPPTPKGGCPKWTDDGKVIAVEGEKYVMKVERSTGKIVQDGSSVPLLRWPTPFFARAYHMLSPENPGGFPYQEYPDESTRKIESITAEQRGDALAIKVQDSYKGFAGFSELLIDKTGNAVISFKYVLSGEPLTTSSIGVRFSEMGLRFVFDKKCQEIRWLRDSEWDVYPDGNLGRPEGAAQAHMDKKWGNPGPPPYLTKPAWPWEQDENRYGTRDFRCAKYHIYSASLFAPDGSGIDVTSNGTTTDVRANLSSDGVEFHILKGWKPARVLDGFLCFRHVKIVDAEFKFEGSFAIKLLAPKK